MTLSLQHQADPWRFTLHGSRFTVPLCSIVLALLSAISTACGTTSQSGKVLFDDPQGSVSLKTITDRSIQANHPINLEPALLTQLLTGIELHDEGLGEHHVKGVQTLITGNATLSYPLFSQDQIQFLAPLVAEALRKATPNESVEFRVVTTIAGSNRFQSATTETTTGSVYAYGRQLYVILSQYNYNPMLTNLSFTEASHRSQDPLDYSGLKYRTLRFTPKAALRVNSPDPPTMEKPTDRFIAVDYQLLQQAWRNLEAKKQALPQTDDKALEAARAAEAQARAAEAQARTAEAQARHAAEAQARAAEAQARNTEALAQEVEVLKKQLESIQKQLGSQSQQQK
jgi:regulator of protease activity HflC (stomatin/prohibitin superfamily)